MNMTNEAKIRAMENAFGGFNLTVECSTGGNHGGAQVSWIAGLKPFRYWNICTGEWCNGENTHKVGQTPSLAMNALWEALAKVEVFTNDKCGDGYAYLFMPAKACAIMIDEDHEKYPKVASNQLLQEIEWPPSKWTWVDQPVNNNNWATTKSGNYLKLNGSKVKVKQLKLFIGELNAYYNNDVELPPDLVKIETSLRQNGLFRNTPEMIAKIEAEQKAIIEANAKLSESYAKAQAAWHAANPGQPGQSPDDKLQQTITTHMQKWGKKKW